MKIVLFGATGNVGQRITKEALDRGHQVIAVVRDAKASTSPDPRATLVSGDGTDAASIAAVAKGADAVISSISPRPNARGLAAPSLVTSAHAFIKGLADAGVKRFVIVGGAGSLEVAPGQALVDQSFFPEAYKAEANEARAALKVYRAEAGELDWTYLSPAAEIFAGERTGKYRTTGDAFFTDAAGKSRITFEDYAVALVDELEHPKHVGKRFGVAY
jgi:putative NADH-flavin reductase